MVGTSSKKPKRKFWNSTINEKNKRKEKREKTIKIYKQNFEEKKIIFILFENYFIIYFYEIFILFYFILFQQIIFTLKTFGFFDFSVCV
jgi:hypothetical protein